MKDLTGQIINNRLITGLTDEKSGGHWKWDAKCLNCGKTFKIRETELRKAVCRCSKKSRPVLNMAGERYGKWVVTDKYEIGKDAHAHWWCVCDCGNESWVSRPNLISGMSASCGCVNNLIDWNGMRFHSKWEIYVAMVMEELKIKYEREKDKIEVIDENGNKYNYIPDFTIIKNNIDQGWVEVKGTHPKIEEGLWKTQQASKKYSNLLIVNEKILNEILGVKYYKIDKIYYKGGLPLVQDKINQIMKDVGHANKIREMLSFS